MHILVLHVKETAPCFTQHLTTPQRFISMSPVSHSPPLAGHYETQGFVPNTKSKEEGLGLLIARFVRYLKFYICLDSRPNPDSLFPVGAFPHPGCHSTPHLAYGAINTTDSSTLYERDAPQTLASLRSPFFPSQSRSIQHRMKIGALHRLSSMLGVWLVVATIT